MAITAALAACVLAGAAGAAEFSQPAGSPYPVGDEGMNGIATGDLNEDGRTDVVTANIGAFFSGAPSYSAMLADPDGSLSPAPGGKVTMAGYPGPVALGDVNGDHHLDLVVREEDEVSEESQVSVYLGRGDGTFAATAQAVLSGDRDPFALAVADLDDDGLADVVVTNFESNNVSVYYSTGDGFTQAPSSPYAVGSEPISVAVGDLNGDGRPDIVTGNHGSFFGGAISVLLQQPTGAFALGGSLAGEYQQWGVALGRFDANDSLDIAAVASPNQNLVLQLNNGDGTFTGPSTPSSYPSHYVTSLAVADFNGDGVDDVALPIYEPGNESLVQVVYGMGDGSFSPADFYPLAGVPEYVASGDFNGDGRPDVVASVNGSALTVLLDLAPEMVVEPGTIDFGGIEVGESAGPEAVRVANEGTATLHLGEIELNDSGVAEFSFDASDCGADLEPGEECTVEVEFFPSGPGTATATLEIGQDGGPAALVELSGEGLVVDGSLSPSTYDFGDVFVGEESAAGQFTVENSGDAPLHVDGAALVGAEAGQFELDQESCEDIALEPGETCVLSVTFAPTAGGAHTAEIEVLSDAETTIRGEVEGSGRVEPGIVRSPDHLGFGVQSAGAGPGAPQTITVESTGATPLHVGNVELGGSMAGQFEIVRDGCGGTTIAPGAQCSVEVAFNPTELGGQAAHLSIQNDAGAPVDTSLAGTAYPNPGIAVDPAVLDFGNQIAAAGPGAPRTITVESTGTTPLQMADPAFEGADADQFQIVANGCAGAALEPGESCDIEVAFAPTSIGGKSADLVVNSNNTQGWGPPTVALTGTGTETPRSPEEEKPDETKPDETKPDDAKTVPAEDGAKPTPSTPAPPVAPVCVPVTVKKLAPYTVKTKARPGAPGLRARFTLGAPGLVEVIASVTYKLDGKPTSASLGKSRLRAGSSVNYKVAIPAKLRPVLTPGTPVTLKLRYRAKSSAAGCDSFGKPATKNLRTQVVLVSR